MNITIEDLRTITEEVLTTVAGMTPCATAGAATPATGAWLEGKIQIHGRCFHGELTVGCGPQMAAALASSFFGEPISLDRVEDTTAALLEVANILAGHINALMASPSRITLPQMATPTSASTPAPAKGPALAATYACEGQDLVVTLAETGADRGGE